MIIWNAKLYMDQRVQKAPDRFRNYFEKKSVRQGYCIALSENSANSLEIYSSRTFWFQFQRERELHIVGLASSYEEAVEVVIRIINDVRKTMDEISSAAIREYFTV